MSKNLRIFSYKINTGTFNPEMVQALVRQHNLEKHLGRGPSEHTAANRAIQTLANRGGNSKSRFQDGEIRQPLLKDNSVFFRKTPAPDGQLAWVVNAGRTTETTTDADLPRLFTVYWGRTTGMTFDPAVNQGAEPEHTPLDSDGNALPVTHLAALIQQTYQEHRAYSDLDIRNFVLSAVAPCGQRVKVKEQTVFLYPADKLNSDGLPWFEHFGRLRDVLRGLGMNEVADIKLDATDTRTIADMIAAVQADIESEITDNCREFDKIFDSGKRPRQSTDLVQAQAFKVQHAKIELYGDMLGMAVEAIQALHERVNTSQNAWVKVMQGKPSTSVVQTSVPPPAPTVPTETYTGTSSPF